jgi:putative CocE/NonD family hydrolase
MRDGVHLSVDIYQPAAPGRYPGLLSITPYDNNSGWKERAKWFAQRGYAVVLADSRGRYDSEGEWDPFAAKHKTDGYDLVEWVAKQEWCNGRVGMYGPSYMGWETWWTATQAPPSLKAIVPEVAPPDQFWNAPYQNGVLVAWIFDWQAGMAGRTAQAVGDGPYGGFAETRAEDMMRTPYIDLNRSRGVMDAPWFETWIKDNLSTADYWKAIAYQGKANYSRVTVPSLAISGWFDANHPGTPMNYIGVKQFGGTPEARHPRLVIGPWTHWPVATRNLAGIDYGPEAAIDWDGYVTRWFDHFLKAVDNGVENDPPVHVFVMGVNQWRAESDWPLPETQWTKYYLHGHGKANSLKGDGALNTAPPDKETFDTYVYDPATPTRSPFTGGHIDGAVDTRLSAIGDEVLVYSTPQLKEDVEVVGPITATLFAATSAHDTDWMMRLIDVRPDGSTLFLTDGVLRARSRDPENHGRFTAEKLNVVDPNRIYEYTLEFWRGTGNIFQKGHRIRVEISSSFFPYYLRNLNSGDDNIGLETNAVVATQRVYHDAQHPSSIVLPVIPPRGP